MPPCRKTRRKLSAASRRGSTGNVPCMQANTCRTFYHASGEAPRSEDVLPARGIQGCRTLRHGGKTGYPTCAGRPGRNPGAPVCRHRVSLSRGAPGGTMPALPGACYVRFFLMDAASADHGHAPPCLPDTRAPVCIIHGSAPCCRELLAPMDARGTGRGNTCVAPPAAHRGDPSRA